MGCSGRVLYVFIGWLVVFLFWLLASSFSYCSCLNKKVIIFIENCFYYLQFTKIGQIIDKNLIQLKGVCVIFLITDVYTRNFFVLFNKVINCWVEEVTAIPSLLNITPDFRLVGNSETGFFLIKCILHMRHITIWISKMMHTVGIEHVSNLFISTARLSELLFPINTNTHSLWFQRIYCMTSYSIIAMVQKVNCQPRAAYSQIRA
jgi:hypothetical protein